MRHSPINHRFFPRLRVAAVAMAAAAAAALAGASGASASTCDLKSGALQVNLDWHTNLEVAGGTIAVSHVDGSPVVCTGGTPTIKNTDVIRVIDLTDTPSTPLPRDGSTTLTITGPESFKTSGTYEPDGGSEIEIVVNMSSGTDDRLVVHAGHDHGADWVFGSYGLSWNKDTDVDLMGGPFQKVTLNGRDFTDRISAQGGRGTGFALSTPAEVEISGRGGHDVLLGSEVRDQIDGGEGNDTLSGFGGSDILMNQAGDDTFTAGAGVDYLNLALGTGPATLDLNRTDRQNTGYGMDAVADVENVYGTNFADTITGNGVENAISGGNGDDVIDGRGGADQLVGGDGVDTVTFAQEPEPVHVDLLAGKAYQGGIVDAIQTMENVVGSPFGDKLLGDSGPNRVVGGAGTDSIVTANGLDVVEIRDGERDEVSCGDDQAVDRVIGDRRGVDAINPDCDSVEFLPEPEQPQQPQQPGGGGGEGPGIEQPDTSLTFALTGARTQRVLTQRSLNVRVACPAEPCTTEVRASGTLPRLRGARAATRLSLRKVVATVTAGSTRTVKLRLTKAQLAAIRRTLAARRKPTLKVTAVARDAAGNTVTRTLRVTVRR